MLASMTSRTSVKMGHVESKLGSTSNLEKVLCMLLRPHFDSNTHGLYLCLNEISDGFEICHVGEKIMSLGQILVKSFVCCRPNMILVVDGP